VAQIPWGHNRLIISKIKDISIAEFYVEQCLKNAWDRDTLEIQIKSMLHSRVGSSSNNFQNTLPDSHFKLANEALKDPYNFDFLSLQEDALEKVIEDELTKHITKFLLELGNDVADAAGSEYLAEVDNVSRKKRVVVNVKDPRRGALQREMSSGRLARALGSVKK
jgi:predicted nuclease of restriction endonuclease-like (RecB) superfamily